MKSLNIVQFFKVTLLVLLMTVSTQVFGQKGLIKSWEYSQVGILALSLARSGNIIPESDMAEVIANLSRTGKAPRRYQIQFDKLIQTAQMIIEIKGADFYFPVGFEFESGHHTEDSLEKFKAGAKKIAESVAETFGIESDLKLSFTQKEGDDMRVAELVDDAKGKWSIVQEYVRDESSSTTPTGWETVSPPIFNRDYLKNMAGFLLRLGANPYGREAEFTGAHQTFDILPQGVKFESGLAGRAVANYMLLMQQFAPVIFGSLQVERYGGYKNFFIRPLIFDHAEMLIELSEMRPESLDLAALHKLMYDKYVLAEYDAHIRSSMIYSEKQKQELLKVTDQKKRAFAKLWKYHDLKVHFNAEKPERTLIETRIGDYRQGSPESILRVTYLNQLLLTTAYRMAAVGKIHRLDVPLRSTTETEDQYWKRLLAHPASSEAAFFKTLEVDSLGQALIRERSFSPRDQKFKATSVPSFGFEKEFFGHEIVNLIVPNDPEARKKWRSWSMDRRVEYFANLIADPKKREIWYGEERLDYTPDMRRIVVAEFQADTFKYPFLDPFLFLEDSGNFEVKSNGRDILTTDSLIGKIGQISKPLKTTYFGAHIHLFVPDSLLADLRLDHALADRAVGFLERLSLFMQAEDYRTADGSNHDLDSWSLDRFSPQDLSEISSYFKGTGKIGNVSQKYHNVGVRQVDGGVDIELRSVGDEISYMQELVQMVTNAFINRDFGVNHRYGMSRPLFHDFTAVVAGTDVSKFTLANALSQRFPMTKSQLDIAHKLQFEIYKPSMAEYVVFPGYDGYLSADPAKMDLRYVRTNFETNVALPILNYEDQPYFSKEELERVAKARESFLKKLHEIVIEIERSRDYAFLRTEKDFLHLAYWLERSTHSSRPNLNKVEPKLGKQQAKILEKLVHRLRRKTMNFIKESELSAIIRVTFTSKKNGTTLSRIGQSGAVLRCKDVF